MNIPITTYALQLLGAGAGMVLLTFLALLFGSFGGRLIRFRRWF